MKISQKQQGKSPIVLIIILALIGVGVYIGQQYIPLKMEVGLVDSILDDVEKAYDESQPKNIAEVQGTIEKYLTINQEQDLKDSFKVTKKDGEYIVRVNLERELDLLYTKKPMNYDREIDL